MTTQRPSILRSKIRNKAMTIVEVSVAISVVALVFTGTLAAMIQARRLTELAIYQNSANTIMQGYLEQMKNMSFDLLIVSPPSGTATSGATYVANYSVPTERDDVTPDSLVVSPLPIANASTVASDGSIPGGVYDNVRNFDVRAPGSGDLTAHIWVWVQDLTTQPATATSMKGITMVYMWQFKDGNQSRYFVSSVRTLRSVVASY